jgi:hypothetical protein
VYVPSNKPSTFGKNIVIIGEGIGAINSVSSRENRMIARFDFMPRRFITLLTKNAAMMNGEESNIHMKIKIEILSIYSVILFCAQRPAALTRPGRFSAPVGV